MKVILTTRQKFVTMAMYRFETYRIPDNLPNEFNIEEGHTCFTFTVVIILLLFHNWDCRPMLTDG